MVDENKDTKPVKATTAPAKVEDDKKEEEKPAPVASSSTHVVQDKDGNDVLTDQPAFVKDLSTEDKKDDKK